MTKSAAERPILGETSRAHALRDASWVAAFLGVSTDVVYAWAKSGELPSIRLGRILRFNPEAIRAWVARHTNPPANSPTPGNSAKSASVSGATLRPPADGGMR